MKKVLRSPLNYKWSLDHKDDDDSTKSKDLGTATHLAILEPHRMATDIVVWPEARRGNGWKEFEARNSMCQILTTSEMETVVGMRDSVRGYAPAMRYLKHGYAEVTMRWIDPASGRQMHGRIDWLTFVDGQWTLVDVKTTRDSSQRRFGQDAYKYGYHIQFGLYVDGFFFLIREMPRFVVIAVESKPPYEPAVYSVSDEILELGHDEYTSAISTITGCEEAGIWPPALQMEQPLVLPRWAMPSDDDDDLSELGLDLNG
jgi:hypothetical protein